MLLVKIWVCKVCWLRLLLVLTIDGLKCLVTLCSVGRFGVSSLWAMTLVLNIGMLSCVSWLAIVSPFEVTLLAIVIMKVCGCGVGGGSGGDVVFLVLAGKFGYL